MKKIFITGANGFIGKHVVDYLSKKNEYEIYTLIRPNSLPRFLLRGNVHVCFGDMRDEKSLLEAIPNGSYIINLAANPYHPKLSYSVNVVGTGNLLLAAKKKNVSKIVHVSSQATKIKVKGVYAKTKLESDELVQKSEIPFVILKPSLVVGTDEKGLFSKIAKLLKLLPIVPVFGDGQINVYPVLVEDFARVIEAVVNDETVSSETFDIGASKPVTYNELYAFIMKQVGIVRPFLHIPVWLGLSIAKLLSFLQNPPLYADNILGSTQDTKCDTRPFLKRYPDFKLRSFDAQTNKVNVAIVGLGKMGMLHASILTFFKDAQIVALIDTNKSLFNTIKSMGISGRFYQSLEEAYRYESIDAVYIITPTFTHYSLLNAALKNNSAVFVEKPAVLNLEELNKLKAENTKHPLPIHVGYTLLYNPVFMKLRDIVLKGEYGKVLSYTAKFEHGEVFGPKKGWMFNKKLSGGGVLMNPGPHLFSVLHSLFGIPQKITGSLYSHYVPDLDDEGTFSFMHPTFSGKVSLSWSVPNKAISYLQLAIRLERADIVADGKDLRITCNSKTEVINFRDLGPFIPNTFDINPDANGEAYYIEDRLFINSVKNKLFIHPSPNDLDAALQIESIIHNCYKCSPLNYVKQS